MSLKTVSRFDSIESALLDGIKVSQDRANAYPERFNGTNVYHLSKAGITPEIAESYGERFDSFTIIELHKARITPEKAKTYSEYFTSMEVYNFARDGVVPEKANAYDYLKTRMRKLVKAGIIPVENFDIKSIKERNIDAETEKLENRVNDQKYRLTRELTGLGDQVGFFYYIGGSYEVFLDVDIARLVRSRLNAGKLRVLDIGCGDAIALSELEKLFSAEVNDGRLELQGLSLPKHRTVFKKVTYAHLLAFEPETRFDLILSVACLPYIADKFQAMEHIYNKLLAVGGEAYIHAPARTIAFEQQPKLSRKQKCEQISHLLKGTEGQMRYAIQSTGIQAKGVFVAEKRNTTELKFPATLLNATIRRSETLEELKSTYSVNK